MAEITDFRFWSARRPTPPGALGRWSRWIDLSSGRAYANRGFAVLREVNGSAGLPGGIWTHRHTDGTDWPWWYEPDKLVGLKTDDTLATLKSSMSTAWQFAAVRMASPLGVSVFFNGTNSEAALIRKDSGTGELEAVGVEIPQPGVVSPTTAATGGNLSDGTYDIRHTWLDDSGAVTLESGPSDAMTITLSAGTSTQKITVPDPGSEPTHVTKRRIYLSVSGDTASGYLRSASMEVAVGSSYDITEATSAMTIAINSRNGSYRTAALPLTGINVAVVHLDRLFVASTTSNKVYWTERDSLNWYSTNNLVDGGDTSLNGHIKGMVSFAGALWILTTDAVYRASGDFSRDSTGTSPTYAARYDVEPVDTGIGCVSGRSIVAGNGTIFFMSNEGPAMIRSNAVALVGNADIRDDFSEWDWDNLDHCHGAMDHYTGCVCWAVPRKTNASRPQDGASTSGMPDRIYRLQTGTLLWNAPLDVETGGLAWVAYGTAGTSNNPLYLMGLGPYGDLLRFNYGWSGGKLVTSGTNFDGKLASSSTTTTATVTLSGVSADDFKGMLVELRYPDNDVNFPGESVIRTIKTNTSSVVTWAGALTVPSGTNWTVRVASLGRDAHLDLDLGARGELQMVEVELHDVVGMEAAS